MVDEEEPKECSICLTELDEDDSFTLEECRHCFHTECIVKSLRRSSQCPYCRNDPHKSNQNNNETDDLYEDAVEDFHLLQLNSLKYSVMKCRKLSKSKKELKEAVKDYITALNTCKEEIKPFIEQKQNELFETYKVGELRKKMGTKKATYTRTFNKIAKEKDSASTNNNLGSIAKNISPRYKLSFLSWKLRRFVQPQRHVWYLQVKL